MITKEQFEQLKDLNNKEVNSILGIGFEVGKWYRHSVTDTLYYHNGGEYAFGFLLGESFVQSLKHDWNSSYKVATKEEVLEAFIKEAKKRGLENIGEISITTGGVFFKKGCFSTTNNEYTFEVGKCELRLDGVTIFENGVWAEVLDEKAEIKEEIKELKEKLKALENKL